MTLQQSSARAPVLETLKLVTQGRLTGLPHIVELRYVHLDGSFFALAGNSDSDWILNALSRDGTKVRILELTYQVIPRVAAPKESLQVIKGFREKYGSSIVDQWYSNSSLCVKLTPTGPPNLRSGVRGENETRLDFQQWKAQRADYFGNVQEAFDSAAEEYDFTISHNFINTWIRKRSIKELLDLVRPDDILLEIGCGTGAEAITISKHVRGIVATDVSDRMLDLVSKKVLAKKLTHKILPAKARASQISSIANLLEDEKVRIAYSFNGVLNLELNIRNFPAELSKVVRQGGYFVCSARNIICLSEMVVHAAVLQLDKVSPRKEQPTMVSVGGIDIPAYYLSPRVLSKLFQPYFKLKKLVGLPAFLPPAYLNQYCIRFRPVTFLLEKLETALAQHFPFNRLGEQTLLVFQRV